MKRAINVVSTFLLFFTVLLSTLQAEESLDPVQVEFLKPRSGLFWFSTVIPVTASTVMQ